MFAAIGSDQVVEGFGLPAAIVIIALAGVCIFLFKRLDNIQEQRLAESKEIRDKVAEPLNKIADVTEKTYEILIQSSADRRRR